MCAPEGRNIADKGYRSADFEAELDDAGIALIRPATKPSPPGPARSSRDPCARSSNQSTRPSRPNSASNATADEHAQAPRTACRCQDQAVPRAGDSIGDPVQC